MSKYIRYVNDQGERMMFLAEEGRAVVDMLLDQRINASDAEKEYIDSLLSLNNGDLCLVLNNTSIPFDEVLFGEPWEIKH